MNPLGGITVIRSGVIPRPTKASTVTARPFSRPVDEDDLGHRAGGFGRLQRDGALVARQSAPDVGGVGGGNLGCKDGQDGQRDDGEKDAPARPKDTDDQAADTPEDNHRQNVARATDHGSIPGQTALNTSVKVSPSSTLTSVSTRFATVSGSPA